MDTMLFAASAYYLVHWKKYPGNPVIRSDDSSGILVDDGKRLRPLHHAPRRQALGSPRDASLLPEANRTEPRTEKTPADRERPGGRVAPVQEAASAAGG